MSLSICLISCQFQPGVAYKSVAYKKKRVHENVALKCEDATEAISQKFLASSPDYLNIFLRARKI